jgi:hypothetical protein
MNEILNQETIIEQYGLKFNPNFSCQHNGLLNALRIAMQEPETVPFPKLFQVEFPERDDFHLYPVWQGIVLNGHVTAEPGKYPDFSLEDLQKTGKDITKLILGITILAYFKDNLKQLIPYQKRNDKPLFRLVIDSVFSEQERDKALACLVWTYQREFLNSLP